MSKSPRIDPKRTQSSKDRTKQRKQARRAKMIAALALTTVNSACSAPETHDTLATYALTVTTNDGNVYVADYNLTADDCAAALSRTMTTMSNAQHANTIDITCEVE